MNTVEKSLSKMFVVTVLIFCFFVSVPLITNAETHVYADDLASGGAWNASGSPYVLEDDVYVPQGVSLSVGPGVTVFSASTSAGTDPHSLTFNGDIVVSGTQDAPVTFLNLYSLYFSQNHAEINHAIFDGTGVDMNHSTAVFDSVKIVHASDAIHAKTSRIDILKSEIRGNERGVGSYKFAPIFQARTDTGSEKGIDGNGVGGIGNALELADTGEDTVALDPSQNVITIHGSYISDNERYNILNQTLNPVDATQNWWGSVGGPDMTKISGLVDVSPWLDKNPLGNTCCSSVLFFPGIEASRLYKDGHVPLLGTTTNTLWEPNRNDDVRKMFMDGNGVSLDPSIYTKDILDSAFGLKNIYKKFVTMMDGVVADGTIHEWLPYAYDWRKNVPDVVDQHLLDEIDRLASTSKTGKIMIIAHSNGGLVAKELMRRLEMLGKGALIEKALLVAVPELGTPKSIVSMLHGYDQSILGGLILSQATARNFSQNVLGAYGLLPSRQFLLKNTTPLIQNNNQQIISYENMKQFLTANSWSVASSTDMSLPLLLKSSLMSIADSFHSLIDTWRPATSTKTLSIIGWGMPTVQGIQYSRDPHCLPNISQCHVVDKVVKSNDGDGTVLTNSMSGNSDTSLFFNLKQLQTDTQKDIEHADILEASPLLDLVKSQVAHAEGTPPPDQRKYFSTTQPIDDERWLSVDVFSPVDIDVYDKNGNHTGRAPNPIPGNELEYVEQGVLGAHYEELGDTKELYLPYDNGPYQIVLRGNDAGAFIVKSQVMQGATVIASTTFNEMPATPLLNVDLVISTSTKGFASSSVMYMDVDGDGTTDLVNHSAEFLKASSTNIINDFSTYIESMRKMIISLHLPVKQEKSWLDRLDRVEQVVSKKHPRKVERFIKKLSTKRFKDKGMTEEQKTAVVKVFEDLISRLEILGK